MWTTTTALQALVAGSHTSSCKVEVLVNDQVVTTIGPSVEGLAGVVDGSVTQDRGAAVRTRANLTLVDPNGIITPRKTSDPLQPYGQEIRPYRGVLVNGVVEWVPLGTLPITTAERSDDGTFTISVEAHDRALTVARRRSTTGGYTIASGTNVADAIRGIIISRFPSVTFLFETTTSTLPALAYDETEDLWAAAQELATSIGMEVFFDRLGRCILQTIPDPLASAQSGSIVEGANLVSVRASASNNDTYSRVIVTGETTTGAAPVRASVADVDPRSGTYYLGPFGDVPKFLNSPLVTTSAQASVVAAALLRKVKGLTETIEARALPNPALDAGDVVRITRTRAAVDDLYVLESVEIPLQADGVLSASARKRTVS